MTGSEQKKAAKEFSERWAGKGSEKSDSQKFWIDLLEHVFGINDYVSFIEFEDKVLMDKKNGWIDGYIPTTKVLIEQKSIDVNLKHGIAQNDGSLKTPYQQAITYIMGLPAEKHPYWVITCNFESFFIYDMNKPNSEPEIILLKDLYKEYYRLEFIVNNKKELVKKEYELSYQAGELVGNLYDAFYAQYKDTSNEKTLEDLNELCVRLVFCLYAEDAGLFGRKNVFHDYLSKFEDLGQMRKALIELFKVLDQPLKDRDPYQDEDLNQFPYVNGGLFSNENIEIPTFTKEIRDVLLSKAADGFDWSDISPTIFGAMFESTLNQKTKRDYGMTYTSVENIHKVIDPLFLDELNVELNEILGITNEKRRNTKLDEFQDKMSSMVFFDPACGSGNFLTETYLSLRRIENKIIETKAGKGQITAAFEEKEANPIKVSIDQFYGIEINDFAVKVAKTALWIAESQMWKETIDIIETSKDIEDFLPLHTYDNIIEGNALAIDWNEVINNNKCTYIMGNPPFVGSSIKEDSDQQKKDMEMLFSGVKGAGKLDYVCGWYKKAAEYIQNTKIRCAFVSTNSITQGEQVSLLWKDLFDNYDIKIDFAYKSFVWMNEAKKQATVVCVIVGFSLNSVDTERLIFENGQKKKVKYINGYLIDQEEFYIKSRTKFDNGFPSIIQGNKPWDGGNLLLSKEEKDELIEKYPNLSKVIKRFYGGKELINNKERYCLWLKDVSPLEYHSIPEILKRLEKVAEERQKTRTPAVQQQAKTPMLFSQIRQPDVGFLAIPEVSTSARKYIPMSYLGKDDITSNKIFMIPDCPKYIFGILTSNVHMAWTRIVAGRLGLGYSYSPSVYNNFPWPKLTEEKIQKIEKTAENILNIRKKYEDCSLAVLYNESIMPPDLRTAHQLNDKAVWEAYDKKWDINSEKSCFDYLKSLYEKMDKKED